MAAPKHAHPSLSRQTDDRRSLRDAIKAVTGMIEPIMIILMGSVVGFIAMAILLPIFKMSSIVSGG